MTRVIGGWMLGVAVLLTGGVAWAQEPSAPPSPVPSRPPVDVTLCGLLTTGEMESVLGEEMTPAPADGGPLSARMVAKRWHVIRERAGVLDMPFKACRHAAASQLLRLGVDARTVAELMGHDPAMLLRTYAHVIDQQRRDAMRALAESYGIR